MKLVRKVAQKADIGTFDYTNETLVTGDQDGQVRVYDSSTYEEKLNYSHKGTITSLDISFDGLIASASLDSTCALYSTKDRKKIKTLVFAEHENSRNLPFYGCKFSKSGDILFTLSSDEYSYVTQWDLHEMLPAATFKIHTAPIKVFTMSLDGFFIGIGTSDGWVKVLNTRTMDFEMNSKEFDEPTSAISFTYDSRHLVLCSGKEMRNAFNVRGEGFFSKASKVWVVFIFLLWIYLFLR